MKKLNYEILPQTFGGNKRTAEFVDAANQHLSELQGQLGQLSFEYDAEFSRRCAEVEK
jgi:hypothetical protein